MMNKLATGRQSILLVPQHATLKMQSEGWSIKHYENFSHFYNFHNTHQLPQQYFRLGGTRFKTATPPPSNDTSFAVSGRENLV